MLSDCYGGLNISLLQKVGLSSLAEFWDVLI